MACDPITDYLVRETGRYLPNSIKSRVFPRSPIMRLMPRAGWPQGLGQTINLLTYERSAPYAAPSWTDVTVVSGAEGGACLPAAHEIRFGSTARSMHLEEYVLHGPDFCAVEFQSPFELSRQLEMLANQLGEYSRIVWEMKTTLDYFTFCKYKAVIDGCGSSMTYTSTMAASYPAACPTQLLDIGHLDFFKALLLRDGIGETAIGVEDGMPIPVVLCSWEQLQTMKYMAAGRREDLRYGAPNELLRPFGVMGSLYGYYFVAVPFPRRFSCADGTYTEVLPFEELDATSGHKAEVHADYLTAEYEETLIFDPGVMTQRVPTAVTTPQGKFTFNPVDYTGAWMALNIPDKVCNPEGTILFHRCHMMAAAEPRYPERGVALVHKRCDPACASVTECPTMSA